MKKSLLEASLGFSVHTGWAAMIAVAGPAKSPVILDRRRIEMMGDDPDHPRFVYHYAAERLELSAAKRFVGEAIDESRAKAVAAIEAVVAKLRSASYDVVASGILVGNRPLQSTLPEILKSHSLIHTAEGELFRVAIQSASEDLEIPVTEIRVRDLEPRAAKLFGISAAKVKERLDVIGRAAGRPWSKDQKTSLLAALVASSEQPTARSRRQVT